jgi:gas vesicle protein
MPRRAPGSREEVLREEADEENIQTGQSTNRIAWFLTGAIIGVTAALLYAPKSGNETREFLSGKAQEGRDAVTDGTRDILETGRDLFDRGRKLVEDAADLFDRGRRLMGG